MKTTLIVRSILRFPNTERDTLYIKVPRQETFLSGEIPKIQGRFVIPGV